MGPDIIAVHALGGTRLALTFETGECRDLDIANLTPLDGVFAALRDPVFFAQVAVNSELGTIVWPNGADLCPDVLYQVSRPRASHTCAG